MKFSIEDLESLATWLDKGQAVAMAKANEFKELSDRGNVDRQITRATQFRHYSETCREAASRLRVRVKRGAFVPPTLDEVLALAKQVGWPTADAESWHDYFESTGWRMKSGPVVDWRAAMRNGFRRWQKDNKARAPLNSEPDPPRWQTFLRIHKLTAQPHATALAHVKEEFEKWKKANP